MDYLEAAIEKQRELGWTVEALILGRAALLELVKKAQGLAPDLRIPEGVRYYEYLGLPIVNGTGSSSRVEMVCRHGVAGAHIFPVRL